MKLIEIYDLSDKLAVCMRLWETDRVFKEGSDFTSQGWCDVVVNNVLRDLVSSLLPLCIEHLHQHVLNTETRVKQESHGSHAQRLQRRSHLAL